MLSKSASTFIAALPFAAAALLAASPVQTQAQTPGRIFRRVRQGDGGRRAAAAMTSTGRAGYTPQGWRTVMHMKRNAQAPIPEGQWGSRRAVPGRGTSPSRRGRRRRSSKGRPKPRSSSGPCRRRARGRDPLAAADGAIWYTGQLSNKLGRVDPATGAVKEYPLKTPRTGPHGLVEDKSGNIWFTGNGSSLIGRLDPKPARSPNIRCPTRR